MRINLVIASYSGSNNWNRKRKYNSKNKTLYYNLQNIISLQHNLAQITLMKAFDDKPVDQSYYQLPQIKHNFVEHSVENEYFSMGQWLKCYEIYRDNFDYYIFISKIVK